MPNAPYTHLFFVLLVGPFVVWSSRVRKVACMSFGCVHSTSARAGIICGCLSLSAHYVWCLCVCVNARRPSQRVCKLANVCTRVPRYCRENNEPEMAVYSTPANTAYTEIQNPSKLHGHPWNLLLESTVCRHRTHSRPLIQHCTNKPLYATHSHSFHTHTHKTLGDTIIVLHQSCVGSRW